MPEGHLLLCDAFFPEHSRDIWSALNRIREVDFISYYTYHEILDMLAQVDFFVKCIRPYTFVHTDLDAYLWPAPTEVREHLKRALLDLDSQTRREMFFFAEDGQVQFQYACLDLLASPKP
jgi:hypothetical protein